MTLRKGQKLVNYARGRVPMKQATDIPTEAEINNWMALVETYIFYMSDEEFERAFKE